MGKISVKIQQNIENLIKIQQVFHFRFSVIFQKKRNSITLKNQWSPLLKRNKFLAFPAYFRH